MAATEGTAIFVGASGRTYVKDLYLDDVAGAPVNFDSGAGAAAASAEYTSIPEPNYLADVAVVTGAAQTKLHVTRNGVGSGNMLRQTMHLNTLALRPPLRIPFMAGDIISLIQLA